MKFISFRLRTAADLSHSRLLVQRTVLPQSHKVFLQPHTEKARSLPPGSAWSPGCPPGSLFLLRSRYWDQSIGPYLQDRMPYTEPRQDHVLKHPSDQTLYTEWPCAMLSILVLLYGLPQFSMNYYQFYVAHLCFYFIHFKRKQGTCSELR